MRKKIKSVVMVIGAMVFFIGLCICACEQPTMAEQLRTWSIGIPTILAGACAMWFSSRGDDRCI